MRLTDLPNEILEVIFSSLGPDVAARANLMQTCTRLCQIAKRKSVWDSARATIQGIALRGNTHVEWRAHGGGIASKDEFVGGMHRYLFESRFAKELGLLDYIDPKNYASVALIAAASGVPDVTRAYCEKLERASPKVLEQLARLAVGSRSPETLAAVQGPWGVDPAFIASVNSWHGVLFRLAARSGSAPMIVALERLGLNMRMSPVTVRMVMEEAAIHGHATVLDFMASDAKLAIQPAEVFEWVVTPALCHTQPVESGLAWAREFLDAAKAPLRIPTSAFRNSDLHPVVWGARHGTLEFLAELVNGKWLGGTREETLAALRSNTNGALREAIMTRKSAVLRLLRGCGLTSEDARAHHNYALWTLFGFPTSSTVAVLQEMRQQWGLGPADLEGLRPYISIDIFFANAPLLQELRKHWDGVRILGIGRGAAVVQQTSQENGVAWRARACLLCPACLAKKWPECVRARTPALGMHSLDVTDHAFVLAHVVSMVQPAAVVELRRHWGFGPEDVRRDYWKVLRIVVGGGFAGMLETLRREFGLDAADARGVPGMIAEAIERGHTRIVRELRLGFGLGADDARAQANRGIRGAWKAEAVHGNLDGSGVQMLRELALYGLTGDDARANQNELLGKAIAHAQQDMVVELARAPWGLGAADLLQVLPALGMMDALVSHSLPEQARGVGVVRALRVHYGQMGGLGPEAIMREVVPQFARLTRARTDIFVNKLPSRLVAELAELAELGLDAKAVAAALGL